MNEIVKFLLWVSSGTVFLISILAYPVLKFYSPDIFLTIVLGAIFSLFIITLAFLANHWALSRSGKAFMRIVLGGMAIRFLIVGLTLFLVWKFTEFNIFVFIGALLGFYFALQIFEVKFIQKQLLQQQKTSTK